jgi:cytochrome c oxidase assembly factor CtaG
VPIPLTRGRPWLAGVGALLALAVLLPPVGAEARRYVFAQAVQYAILAVVVPALVVLGAPWRRAGRASVKLAGQPSPVSTSAVPTSAVPTSAVPTSAVPTSAVSMRLVDRLAVTRSHRRPGTVRCLTILVGFIALAVFWRLPLAVNAMVTSPVLTVVEAVTLLAAGVALWLELVESPPLLPRIARPLRAAFAAVPMWTIWATAYIMGFSHAVWFHSIGHRPKNGLGVIADQELAAIVLWAVPGICFIPVVYFSLITWLRDTADPDDELRDVPTASGEAKPRPPRPPRGWRLPPI